MDRSDPEKASVSRCPVWPNYKAHKVRAVLTAHLVDGGSQLRRRHADRHACTLKGRDLLFSSPFPSSNDCPCMAHSPARGSRQTSNEGHHGLGFGTLKSDILHTLTKELTETEHQFHNCQ